MFSPKTFYDAQKRKKQWQELKRANNLLTRVDDFESRLSEMEKEIEGMLDQVDEISRFSQDGLHDTKGHRPTPPEEG